MHKTSQSQCVLAMCGRTRIRYVNTRTVSKRTGFRTGTVLKCQYRNINRNPNLIFVETKSGTDNINFTFFRFFLVLINSNIMTHLSFCNIIVDCWTNNATLLSIILYTIRKVLISNYQC